MVIKYFSMFSGIGGFELGMEKSKHEFECIGFSEVDKYATSIYNRHFPRHKCFGDATRINPEELEDFSILIGGFPCQAFSKAGSRKGFADTRGTLFFELARILKYKAPRYFLFENVANLLSHDGGRTFQTILKVCNDLGYDVQWQIYNSCEYGVPQKRERLYLKGYYRRECGSEILSLFRSSKETADLNAPERKDYPNQEPLRIATATKKGYDEAFPYDGVRLDHPKGSTGRGRVQKDLAGTLTCGGNWGTIDQDFLIRRLTPKECERLQGFPDDWTKFGKDGELISDTQRYKCCGNAVTVNVIQHIFDNWDLRS